MDDLISRKALYEAMKNREEMHAKGHCSYDAYNYRVSAEIVAYLPSIPAVPLDKLCEFLEKCGADAYCGACKQIMGECFTDGRGCGSAYFWKELLTKWMEGLEDGKAD